MPTAIIFHPSQERTLADEQRRILRKLNAQDALFFPLYPLYCFFDSGGLAETPPEACRTRIKALTVYPARLDAGRLVFPVEILLNRGERTLGSVAAGRWNKKSAAPELLSDRSFPSESLPLNCRVFQAADIGTNGVFWEARGAVWMKTREK